MAKTAARPALVDTNVLLAATAPARPLHRRALHVLNEWPNQGARLLISGQVIREYLVVATRPVPANGLGLAVGSALKNVAAMRERFQLLEEGATCSKLLIRLVREHGCRGKSIHDANLVATLQSHRQERLVTANVRDFRRFESLVDIVDLASISLD